MSRRPLPDRMPAQIRRGVLVVGAVVLIAALVLIGGLTGGSGHGSRGTTGHVLAHKVASKATGSTNGAASLGPAEVADRFAAAFEASAWSEPSGALAARVRAWSTPSLSATLSAPNGGGPSAALVAGRSVTSARVLSTAVDRASVAQDLALVTLRLTTSSAGAAPISKQVALPLSLRLIGHHWMVDSVPGLVQ